MASDLLTETFSKNRVTIAFGLRNSGVEGRNATRRRVRMFVRIENPVSTIPSFEMMRTLGASSSRGEGARIGQFGSGWIYSLALMARKGLLGEMKICLGKDVYTPFIKESKEIDSYGQTQTLRKIWIKKQGGGTFEMNIDADFGIMDWHHVDMALREYISNAIDGADGDYSRVIVETCADNQCRAKEGTIRIYVPGTIEILEYIREKEKYFLGFTYGYNPNQTMIPNRGGPSRFYRKGVFVGEFGENALWHYNIPDISLKESRVVDSSEARDTGAKALCFADKQTIKTWLESWNSGTEWYEHTFDSYDLSVNNHDSEPWERRKQAEQTWLDAYHAAYGDGILCESSVIAGMVLAKGYVPIVLLETPRTVLKRIEGIKQAKDILTADEVAGKQIIEASQAVKDTVVTVWGWLIDFGMTNGKPMPSARCYREIDGKTEGGTFGYYRQGEPYIYVRSDIAESRGEFLTNVIIEEIGHYVTSARDCTREFQTFAFQLAAKFLSI